MILVGHQPEYLPYMGFFYKVLNGDALIFADNLQFKKKNFQNRNRIRTPQGFLWLNVPVHSKGDDRFKNINEMRINNDSDWAKKHWALIEDNYRKAPYFEKYADDIKAVYEKEWNILSNLNIELTTIILKLLGIERKIFRASDFDVKGRKNEYIANLCKAVGADTYCHGTGGSEGADGENYIDTDLLEELGVKSIFSDFSHPEYMQRWKPFIPNMSIIDLLFMHGEKSLEIIKSSGKIVNTKEGSVL